MKNRSVDRLMDAIDQKNRANVISPAQVQRVLDGLARAEKRIESLEAEVRRLNRTVFPLDQWDLP
jgi:hypothetical protein